MIMYRCTGFVCLFALAVSPVSFDEFMEGDLEAVQVLCIIHSSTAIRVRPTEPNDAPDDLRPHHLLVPANKRTKRPENLLEYPPPSIPVAFQSIQERGYVED